ncbi:MAG: FRG domain-containing protein [Rhodospirillaceae bacterium]|nr:MAG: FRG domain-containing protein [Rhodospirillaceae bacterium]
MLKGEKSPMKETVVSTWEEFERSLIALRDDEQKAGRSTKFLYRGQSSSLWPLATTLDRWTQKSVRFSDHFRVMLKAKSQVETFTGHKWVLPGYPEMEEVFRNYDAFSRRQFPDQETYSYMVYLRHHVTCSPETPPILG